MLTAQTTAITASLDSLTSTVTGPSGLADDVAGLCAISILGVSLGSACL